MGVRRTRLADDDHGRWQVTTVTSIYVVDLDRRTVSRVPGTGGGHGLDRSWGVRYVVAHLDDDLRTLPLDRLIRCEVGRPFTFKTPRDGAPGFRPRISTEIREIRALASTDRRGDR